MVKNYEFPGRTSQDLINKINFLKKNESHKNEFD